MEGAGGGGGSVTFRVKYGWECMGMKPSMSCIYMEKIYFCDSFFVVLWWMWWHFLHRSPLKFRPPNSPPRRNKSQSESVCALLKISCVEPIGRVSHDPVSNDCVFLTTQPSRGPGGNISPRCERPCRKHSQALTRESILVGRCRNKLVRGLFSQ